MRRILALIATLAVASASADIAVTKQGRIFCTILGVDSSAIRIRLPAGESLLAKTDVIELRVTDRYLASALLSELPGIAVSQDPFAIRETTDTAARHQPAKPANGCCVGDCCAGPLGMGVAIGAVGGYAAGYGLSALVWGSGSALPTAEIGALIGGLAGAIIADELSHPRPTRKAVPSASAKPSPPKPPGQFVSSLAEGSLAALAGLAIDWPAVYLLNRSSPAGYGLLAISPAGAAAVTALIGKWLEPRGSFSWSMTGAYAGAIGGLLLGALPTGKFPPTASYGLLASPVIETWLGSTLGAVVGYKLGPRLGSLEAAGRFALPTLGAVVTPGGAGKPAEVTGVRLSLLSYRF